MQRSSTTSTRSSGFFSSVRTSSRSSRTFVAMPRRSSSSRRSFSSIRTRERSTPTVRLFTPVFFGLRSERERDRRRARHLQLRAAIRAGHDLALDGVGAHGHVGIALRALARRGHRRGLPQLVSQEGFEPTTKGLRVPCSTAELLAQNKGTEHGIAAVIHRGDGARSRAVECSVGGALRRPDLEDLRATHRADALGRRPPVLHRDRLRVLDLPRGLALHAVSGRHRPPPRESWTRRLERKRTRREAAGIVPPPDSTPTPQNPATWAGLRGEEGKGWEVSFSGIRRMQSACHLSGEMTDLRAELLSVGTELLLGQIVDTNSAYLAGRLAALGLDLLHMSTVGDNLGRATGAVRQAIERSDLVVCTGGLGPTEDDLTREAIAAALGETPAVDA